MTTNTPHWAQATDQRQEALDHDSAPRFYSDAELADRDVFDWFEADMEEAEAAARPVRVRLAPDPEPYDDSPF